MDYMRKKFETEIPKKKTTKRLTILPELKFKKIEDDDEGIPKNIKHQVLYEEENK